MAVCTLPEKMIIGLFSGKGQICGFVLRFLFIPRGTERVVWKSRGALAGV